MTKDVSARGMPGFAREFVRGAAQPCWPAPCGTLVVTGILFLLCVVLITPGLLAGKGYGYFVEDEEDNYGHLTSQVLRIAQSPPPNLTVTIIGPSTTRELLVGAEFMERALREKTGKDVKVHILSANDLKHWEVAMILDHVADRIRGPILIEVSPLTLSVAPESIKELVLQPRLALDSPVFDEEARLAHIDTPRRFGNYFLDHYQFFLARPKMLFNVIRGPVKPKLHMAQDWRKRTDEEFERAIGTITGWLEGDRPEFRKSNLEVYGRIVERTRAHGTYPFVFFEEARNPKTDTYVFATPEARLKFAEYKKDLEQFAAARQCLYWDIQEEAGLTEEDFIDHQHVSSGEARERYTQALMRRIAELLI